MLNLDGKAMRFSIFGFVALNLFSSAQASELPKVAHYSLSLYFLPQEGRIKATAEMTIMNTTSGVIREIPILLYHSLKVESVSDKRGKPLAFTQNITKFADEDGFKVNQVKVDIGRGVARKKTSIVRLTYSGPIFGYTDVMAYVRDRIDENYSLIRPDAVAYPILCSPSWEGFLEASRSHFTYAIEAAGPEGYTIACGGILKSQKAESGLRKFYFQSRIPTWRMDVAMARFDVIEDKEKRHVVYCLPLNRGRAEIVLQAIGRTIDYFTESFGDIGEYGGFTVIEIPDGWGSQAGDFYVLLASSSFTEPGKLSQICHEIAHMWNVRGRPPEDRTRWFDEAFASYFESLAIRAFDGEEAFEADMKDRRNRFIYSVSNDEKNGRTPIAEYWKEELGENSYTKGAWSLYVLHRLIGDEAFKKMVKALRKEFSGHPAGFEDFVRIAGEVSGRKLDKYFDDWIFGAESSGMLMREAPVDEILHRYK